MPKNDANKPTLMDVDLKALGQLSPERQQALERRMAEDPAFCAEVRAHEAAMDAFRTSGLPRTLPAVEERLQRRSRRWMLWVPPLAAAAAALVLVVQPAESPLEEAGLAAKGDPILSVFANRDGRVFPVEENAILRQGDALKFEVQPVNFTYVLILGQDHTGSVQAWHPFDGDESVSVRGKTPLSGSVVLDDAPGSEKAIAVFSNEPQRVEDWRKRIAAGTAKNPAGEEDVFVVSFNWRKAEGHDPPP